MGGGTCGAHFPGDHTPSVALSVKGPQKCLENQGEPSNVTKQRQSGVLSQQRLWSRRKLVLKTRKQRGLKAKGACRKPFRRQRGEK